MSINARDKGIRGEREVIDQLQPVVNDCFIFFSKKPPKLQRNTMQADGGGSDIHGLEFLGIEIKNAAKLELAAWWEQCISQTDAAHKNQIPVLIYKRSKGLWRVRMMGYLPSYNSEDGEPNRLSIVCQSMLCEINFQDFKEWLKRELKARIPGMDSMKHAKETVKAVFDAIETEREKKGMPPLNPKRTKLPPLVPSAKFKAEIEEVREQIRQHEAKKKPMKVWTADAGNLVQQRDRSTKPPFKKASPIVAIPATPPRDPSTDWAYLPYKEQADMAVDWCFKNKWPVPDRRSPMFSQMFDFWYNKKINGEA